MDFWAVVREFGLPLAMLAFVIGAITTGVFISGREKRDSDKIWTERLAEQEKDSLVQLAYVEARRGEERDGRLKAEEHLARVSIATNESIRAMTELLNSIEKELIRGNPRPPGA